MSTPACLYVNTDTNGTGTTSTYVQAVSDPQGCLDQLLVQLFARNTGGAWTTEPAGGSVPETVVCDLTASNTGEVVVSTDDKYAITASAGPGHQPVPRD